MAWFISKKMNLFSDYINYTCAKYGLLQSYVNKRPLQNRLKLIKNNFLINIISTELE